MVKRRTCCRTRAQRVRRLNGQTTAVAGAGAGADAEAEVSLEVAPFRIVEKKRKSNESNVSAYTSVSTTISARSLKWIRRSSMEWLPWRPYPCPMILAAMTTLRSHARYAPFARKAGTELLQRFQVCPMRFTSFQFHPLVPCSRFSKFLPVSFVRFSMSIERVRTFSFTALP